MIYRALVFVLLAAPALVFAQSAFEFSASRQVIYKNEQVLLLWNAPSATSCNSYVDVLDSRGQWVWQFSDSWQSANRPNKGTYEAKPKDDARYYLDCMFNGKKHSAYVEVQVLDRKKYISGEETPRAPIISANDSAPNTAFEQVKKPETSQPEPTAQQPLDSVSAVDGSGDVKALSQESEKSSLTSNTSPVSGSGGANSVADLGLLPDDNTDAAPTPQGQKKKLMEEIDKALIGQEKLRNVKTPMANKKALNQENRIMPIFNKAVTDRDRFIIKKQTGKKSVPLIKTPHALKKKVEKKIVKKFKRTPVKKVFLKAKKQKNKPKKNIYKPKKQKNRKF